MLHTRRSFKRATEPGCEKCECEKTSDRTLKRMRVHFVASSVVLGFADPSVDSRMCDVSFLTNAERLDMLYRVLRRELKKGRPAGGTSAR